MHASIIGRSCHKYLSQVSKVLSWQTHVCHDKTRLLLRQKYACRDKTFVATKLCLSGQNIFVRTKLLSWQIFVVTNMCLSRQAYFCHDKWSVLCLSWQNFCCDKNDIFGSSRQWYASPTARNLCLVLILMSPVHSQSFFSHQIFSLLFNYISFG